MVRSGVGCLYLFVIPWMCRCCRLQRMCHRPRTAAACNRGKFPSQTYHRPFYRNAPHSNRLLGKPYHTRGEEVFFVSSQQKTVGPVRGRFRRRPAWKISWTRCHWTGQPRCEEWRTAEEEEEAHLLGTGSCLFPGNKTGVYQMPHKAT